MLHVGPRWEGKTNSPAEVVRAGYHVPRGGGFSHHELAVEPRPRVGIVTHTGKAGRTPGTRGADAETFGLGMTLA
jgi:hypothetical protein